MGSLAQESKDLEDFWIECLAEAKLRLNFARNYMLELHRDYQEGDIPEDEYCKTSRQAAGAEESALKEYNRILRAYTDLTVSGLIPNKPESRPRAARGSEDREHKE